MAAQSPESGNTAVSQTTPQSLPTDITVEEATAFLEKTRDDKEAADARPQVIVPGGAVSITESAQALFKAIAPSKQLFYRGGAVVELVNDGNRHSIELLDAVAAQSRLEKFVRFVRQAGKQGLERTTISEATAKQYLKSEACREYLPKLNGVLHCALLAERGGELHRAESGYDETTGFFIETKQKPERMALSQAVVFLSGLLNDFDFVTPGDKSRALASLLTPALKLGGFIHGPVPVDVAEADASQSGKTYRQKLVAAVYNQRLAVVTKKAGGVGSMEETFSDHLVKGRAFIQFDNVRGKLDSQALESFITADQAFPVRIPYHGSIQVDPSKFLLFISSNGFEATKDLANRASIIRIRKRENYQFRTSVGRDLLQLVFDWHRWLIGSVFAVIEEWHRQGKPRTEDARHDFKEWCQILDWIVQNIFHEAPLMDGHQQAKERAANPNLTFLRTIAIRFHDLQKLNQPISATDIADLCVEEDMEMPGLAPDKQTVEEGRKHIGRILRKMFGDNSELTVEEFKVTKEASKSKTVAGNDQTLNRYVFSLATPAT